MQQEVNQDIAYGQPEVPGARSEFRPESDAHSLHLGKEAGLRGPRLAWPGSARSALDPSNRFPRIAPQGQGREEVNSDEGQDIFVPCERGMQGVALQNCSTWSHRQGREPWWQRAVSRVWHVGGSSTTLVLECLVASGAVIRFGSASGTGRIQEGQHGRPDLAAAGPDLQAPQHIHFPHAVVRIVVMSACGLD